jgi:penicillin-binding protein 1A
MGTIRQERMDGFLFGRVPVRPKHLVGRPHSAALGVVAGLAVAGLLTAGSIAILVPVLRSGVAIGQRALEQIDRPLRIPRMPVRSTIYGADGSVLAQVYKEQNRAFVPLGGIPPSARRAILAVEDARFYEHGAVDLRAILRALIANVRSGRVVQGGSTITQQLVKDTIVGDQVSLSRKIREAIDAIRIERTYSKDRVLELYLNEVYFGHGSYGLEAASEYYFGEHAGRLTLPESAMLAGIIASPTRFDPIDHPARARRRTNYALQRMRDLGWIGQRQYQHAVAARIRLSSRLRDRAEPGPESFWEQYVIHEFLADPTFGRSIRRRERMLFQGGIRIDTTIDPSMQLAARRAIERRMTGEGLPQSALVSIQPESGAIRAMEVGNWPFGKHRYNLAVDPGGGRSAGSSFKAFTLAAALERGISPSEVFDGSAPRTINHCGGGETWTVHNAEPGAGSYPLWLATADSVNAVFAQVIDRVGPERVARVAHRMGIESPLAPVCPLTLGSSAVSPLEMTSGYSTLANGGIHCKPYVIASVESRKGELLERTAPSCRRSIPARVAAEETAMLRGVIEFGTGTAADIGRPAAGKTGTGDEYRDAWFIGYVPQLTTGVWVGDAKAETPMRAVPGYGPGFGGVLAAPIWHDFMLAATAGMPSLGFAPPPILFGRYVTPASQPPSGPGSPEPPRRGPKPAPPGQGNGHGNGNGPGR